MRLGTRNVLLGLLLLSFGLGFGLNYARSNQVIYLLDSLKALHPTAWTRDWAINHHAYIRHPTYAVLATWMLRLSPTGYAFGIANVLCIALGMLAIYRLLRLFTERERALPALCIVLLLASVTRTQAAGGGYAFSEYFQPSTLGSLGVIAAMVAFVAGRPLLSGLCFAFAAVFHVNYLLLGLCVFGGAVLLGGRARLIPRGLAQLGPALLVLIAYLPFLSASAAPGLSADAQRIFLDIRSPHHYVVPTFAWNFSFWVGFQLLGTAALIGPARQGAVLQQRVLQLLISSWLLVVTGALLSSVVVVRFVQQLMAWRLCPQGDLLAQSALGLALVTVFCEGRSALSTFDRSARWLAGIGFSALVLGSLATGHWNATVVVACLLLAAALVATGVFDKVSRSNPGTLSIGVVTVGLLLALVGANFRRFSRLSRDSNLLSGADPGVAELCEWAGRHTPEAALFLTPPREEELRLRCGRAIVVDWKTCPVVPADVFEWYDRLEKVTGRKPFLREDDLDGYQSLDAARVSALRERYDFDYVVVERGHELALGVAPAFSGLRFVAYALPQAVRSGLGSVEGAVR